MLVFDKQVGGTHYLGFEIQPGVFWTKNKLGFYQEDIIKRICRYNLPTGGGLKDLNKIKHEVDLLIEIEGWDKKGKLMWGFDLDGCVVEIDTLLIKYIKEIYGYTVEKVDITCYELEKCLPLSGRQIKECIGKTIADVDNLFPYPGAIEFLRYYHSLSGKTIKFITARWDSGSTYRWLDKWLPDIPFDVIFRDGSHKVKSIYENGIDIFVEDKLKTAINLAQNNIKVLLLDRPWNQLNELHPNILRMKDWEEIKEYCG